MVGLQRYSAERRRPPYPQHGLEPWAYWHGLWHWAWEHSHSPSHAVNFGNLAETFSGDKVKGGHVPQDESKQIASIKVWLVQPTRLPKLSRARHKVLSTNSALPPRYPWATWSEQRQPHSLTCGTQPHPPNQQRHRAPRKCEVELEHE